MTAGQVKANSTRDTATCASSLAQDAKHCNAMHSNFGRCETMWNNANTLPSNAKQCETIKCKIVNDNAIKHNSKQRKAMHRDAKMARYRQAKNQLETVYKKCSPVVRQGQKSINIHSKPCEAMPCQAIQSKGHFQDFRETHRNAGRCKAMQKDAEQCKAM